MSDLLTYAQDWARRHAPQSAKERFRLFIRERYAYYYYAAAEQTWGNTRWLGVTTYKATTDLWVYQEIVVEQHPDFIIETGTAHGGSAYYLASVCDLLNHGRVITIDIEHQDGRPEHPRIEYVTASSVDLDVVGRMAGLDGTKLVILDSDHSSAHVLAELDAYAPMVSPGSYLIVEDTQVNGHPVSRSYGPGPWEAVQEWLPRHPEFTVDRSREKLMHTQNPNGYLRRARP